MITRMQYLMLYIPVLICIAVVIYFNSCKEKITYEPQKRDSVMQLKIDSLFKKVNKIDSAVNVNDSLILAKDFNINNYITNYENKKNNIINNPIDSIRIVNAKKFLRSKYNLLR